jgi:hypothetical protein
MKALLEEDLYEPIRGYLQGLGYEVRGEVKDCDVVAVKGDLLLVVEMKRSLNLDVILQAVLRQRIADIVYIAVPRNRSMSNQRWRNIYYLLRRLELGLLVVSIRGDKTLVEEALRPEPFSQDMSKRRSEKRKKALLKEFHGRHGDFNIGGSTGRKIITEYREKAIHIATLLREHGQLSIKELKTMGTDPDKTGRILQDNHYGWFHRVRRGVYELNEKGEHELDDYKELVEYYQGR